MEAKGAVGEGSGMQMKEGGGKAKEGSISEGE